MTAPNDPHLTTQTAPSNEQATLTSAPVNIQAVPPKPATPAVQQTAPDTAPRAPLTPEELAARVRRWDAILVGMVLALAFLLGSFRAHNSDFWMHLAGGRLVGAGNPQFGTDPFSYTAPETPWYNTSWLSDLATYWLAGAPEPGQEPVLGGAPLVIAKALLFVATAVVLLLIRRRGQSVWIPAACVALALVVMSPRFTLGPVCASYLLLALTVYLLQRRPAEAGGRRLPARWLVPVLCALWVNVDSWFLLGPLTVALFLVGELLQQVLTPIPRGEDALEPGRLGSLGLVFVASLAACALNPSFLAYPGQVSLAALLPPEVWAVISASPLRADAYFTRFFQSPLQPEWYTSAAFGNNPAGWPAALALLLISLFSFVAARAEWRWWRALAWAVFAVLGLFLVALVPFFAVVAGPIMALNFQGYVARRYAGRSATDESAWQWALGGRRLTALAGAALLLAAWPGWLHGSAYDARSSRHAAWAVETDPSLRDAALRLAELHRDGVLGTEARGFNYVPAVANYCAWFCPEEKGFFDLRFQRFPQSVARRYVEVRRALAPRRADSGGASDELVSYDWQGLFRDAGINHVVLNGATRGLAQDVMERMWLDDIEWSLNYADGRSSIFGWKGPQGGEDPFHGRHFNPTPLAFGPDVPASERVPDAAPPAPETPDSWVDDLLARAQEYWEGPAPYPLEADRAYVYWLLYNDIARQVAYAAPVARRVLSAAGPAAILPTGAGPAYVPLLRYMQPTTPNLKFETALMQGQDFGPPAGVLLAVRAARRAIAASPENEQGYWMLAIAYQQLWDTQERPHSRPGSRLLLIRRSQIINALAHAIRLNPAHQATHIMLAQMYDDAGYKDLALEQWNEVLRLVKEAGPRPDQTDVEFEKEVRQRELKIQELEQQYQLKQRRTQYELRSKGKQLAVRMAMAEQAGLAQQALDILNDADPTQLGPEQALMLLMNTGQAALAKKFDLALGPRDQMVLSWVLGDYEVGDQALDEVLALERRTSTENLLRTVYGVTLQDDMAPRPLAGLNQAVNGVRDQADWLALRGVFALERGQTAAAARYLREALAISLPTVHLASTLSGLTASSPLELLMVAAGDRVEGPGQNFDFESVQVAAHYLKLLKEAGN